MRDQMIKNDQIVITLPAHSVNKTVACAALRNGYLVK